MPELPEVETIIRELNSKIVGKKIIDVYTERPQTLINSSPNLFRKIVKKAIIRKVERKGKYIIISLSDNAVIILHLRMTGRIFVSKCWHLSHDKLIKRGGAICRKPEKILDQNKKHFIRFALFLGQDTDFFLSDVRRFATVELFKDKNHLTKLAKIGTDAMDKSLTEKMFIDLLKKQTTEIKKALLNQRFISGIGNIYADEILFKSKILPQRKVTTLSDKELKRIFISMKAILRKAIQYKGTSFSDFRTTTGEKGSYIEKVNVFRKEGLPCPNKCGSIIEKVKLGGRGTRFCPRCQK